MTSDLGTRAAHNRGAAWTEKEESLLGTMTDRALAAKLGRTLKGVTWKRLAMGIAASEPRERKWTKAEASLLGTMSDKALAAKLGCTPRCVLQTRARRGIAPFSGKNTPRKLRSKLKSARNRARRNR